MSTPRLPVPGTPLTKREKDVLALHAQGLEAAEVAARLAVSPNAVKALSYRARKRLGARNTVHAVALAIASRQLPAGVAQPNPGSGVAA